ncbi:MAG TPA: hemerythrin domain-containing protein [Kofleriaceae bacterium]|nr:hemerythrin domain-containing protein [Kofleriaceae bacterium]
MRSSRSASAAGDLLIQSSGSVGDVLGAHHRDIEDRCLALMSRCGADARSLVRRWEKIEHELFEHMAAEERMVFPAYQRADARNARDLLDEHTVLRERALEIGIAIHLGTIRSEHLQRFVDHLRAHARHEDVSLYRWAQRNLDHNERHALHAQVG